MNVGDREHAGATLNVTLCLGIPARMRKETREISKVYVPIADRKQGIGTALMHKVCDEADAAGITLLLTCDNELRRWYSRFGFMVLQDSIGLLVRMPGSTPHMLKPLDRALDRAIPEYH